MNRSQFKDWKELARETALPCNRDHLQQLRRSKGWTQAQLARVVGYSERLISKAETGHPISLETIENLAEALSSSDKIIYPEDLVVDPLLKTREIILLLQNSRSTAVENIQLWLDEDVELRLVGHRKIKQCPPVSSGRTEVLSVLQYLWIEVSGNLLHLNDIHCVGTGTEVAIWSKLSPELMRDDESDAVQTCSLLNYRRGRVWRIEIMLDASAWHTLTAVGR